MEESKSFVLFKRFARGFVAGGLGAVGLMLATGVTVSNLEDLKKFSLSLIAGFISGGLLATEKAYRWKEPEQPEPLSNESEA